MEGSSSTEKSPLEKALAKRGENYSNLATVLGCTAFSSGFVAWAASGTIASIVLFAALLVALVLLVGLGVHVYLEKAHEINKEVEQASLQDNLARINVDELFSALPDEDLAMLTNKALLACERRVGQSELTLDMLRDPTLLQQARQELDVRLRQ